MMEQIWRKVLAVIDLRIQEAEQTAGARVAQQRWQDAAYWKARADEARDLRKAMLWAKSRAP